MMSITGYFKELCSNCTWRWAQALPIFSETSCPLFSLYTLFWSWEPISWDSLSSVWLKSILSFFLFLLLFLCKFEIISKWNFENIYSEWPMLFPHRLSSYNLDICFIFAEGIIEKGEVFSKAVQNIGSTGKKLLSFGWLAVRKGTTTTKKKSKPSKQRLRYGTSKINTFFIRATSPASVTPLLNMGLMKRGWLVSPLSQWKCL